MSVEVLHYSPARAALVADGRAALVVDGEDAADVAAALASQLAPGEVRSRIERAALVAALDGRAGLGPIDLAAGGGAAYDEALAIIDQELARVAAAPAIDHPSYKVGAGTRPACGRAVGALANANACTLPVGHDGACGGAR